jgi:putative two-component system response regulator
LKIVIVDDSATNLVVLKNLAKNHGEREIITFRVSQEAHDYLAQNTADLVVADCEMPDMDGIRFIDLVRGFEHHRKTPIIMVTSHTEATVRHEALAAGATEFIGKPVDANEFRLRVRNLLALQRTRGQVCPT